MTTKAKKMKWHQRIKELGQTFVREFLFVFKLVPRASALLTFIQFLIGVIPAIELWLAAKIIDELVELLGSGIWSGELTTYVVGLLIAIGIQRIAFSASDTVSNYLRGKIKLLASDRIHRMVISLDLPTIEKARVHSLITYLKDQSWRPFQMVHIVFNSVGNLVASISFIIIAFSFSIWYTVLFVAVVFPSLIYTIRSIVGFQKIAFDKASLMNQVWYFESHFKKKTSLLELMVHQIGEYFADRYKGTLQKVLDKEMEIEKKKFWQIFVANLAAFGVYIYVYIQIIISVLAGIFTIGQFALFAGAYRSLERFIVSQAWSLANLYEHTKYLNAFRDLERLPKIIKEKEGAEDLSGPVEIEFKKVSYQYPNSKKFAVKDVSFKMSAGERVALIGENGAGKSTLVKLMLRLYDPTSGEILVNGKNINEYSLSSLRKVFGVTFQDFERFSITAKENIGLGKLESLSKMNAIKMAAEQSGIHSRIEALPSGYKTYLGQEIYNHGVELSGGEWQKLALSRSLIKDASLLILDEPTAALDARSEYLFFKELFAKAKEQSLLLISHRFSSVRIADNILVLKGGKVVEQGNHEELMKKKGLYNELYELQTKEIE